MSDLQELIQTAYQRRIASSEVDGVLAESPIGRKQPPIEAAVSDENCIPLQCTLRAFALTRSH